MLRSAASKAMWVGRTTAAVVGLAIALALVLGVATMALAAVPGDPFRLGQVNQINAISALAGSTNNALLRITNNSTEPSATALRLQVERGRPPLEVDSATRVANLNADKVDGRDSSDIGINGYEQVGVQSTFDSTAHKSVHARCPEGKLAIGGGAQVFPSLSDSRRNTAPIVLRYSTPNTLDHRSWTVIADEIEAYGFSWWVAATVICATAP